MLAAMIGGVAEQRSTIFDFVARQRRAKPEDFALLAADERDYPQRRTVLRALREVTGKDGGDSPGRWRELIGGSQREGR
jgi:hypothetical protein